MMQRVSSRVFGILAVILLGTSIGYATEYFVSPDGNDSNSGLGRESSKAFRTIQAGVNRLAPGDTLLIRGGTYREQVTFPMSGTAEEPIVVRPCDEEQVAVSGCDSIGGWRKHEGNIWQAPMAWTLGLGRNQVFHKGRVVIEARYPNDPEAGLEMYVSDLSALWPTFGSFSIPDPAKAPGRIVSDLLRDQPVDYWKGACYYGIHYQGWAAQTGVIESSKDGDSITCEGIAYKASIGSGQWTCEWRIPFSACGFTPKSARLVLMNLAVRKTTPSGWVMWRGTGKSGVTMEKAGIVVFPDEFMAAADLPQSSLEVWLDASDAGTIEKDDEGRVSVWKDKSGRKRDARQERPALRPLYSPDGLNGLPSVRFSEKTRTRFELPDLAEDKIDATVFAVFSNPEAGSAVNHHARIFTASDGEAYDYLVGLCVSVPGEETGGPRQLVATFRDRWAKSVRVGCFSPTYQTFLHGSIAEILVYSRAMPQEEQDLVRAYLKTKWRLQ